MCRWTLCIHVHLHFDELTIQHERVKIIPDNPLTSNTTKSFPIRVCTGNVIQHHIELNFCGSLILQIFNRSQQHFNTKFSHGT